MSPPRLDHRCHELIEAKGSLPESDRLHQLFALVWEHDLEDRPEMATYLGAATGHDRWTDWSLSAWERRRVEDRFPLAVADSVDREALGADDQLSLDVFRWVAQQRSHATRFPSHLQPITPVGGPHQRIASVLAMTPPGAEEAALARLEAIPALVEQLREVLDAGLAAGVTPPAVTLRDVSDQVRRLADRQALVDPLPAAVRAAAGTIVDRLAGPALRALADHLEHQYVPRARQTIACRDLPDGEDWYLQQVASHTTSRLGIEQIHELGLAEVQRIREAMDDVIAEVGFDGGFRAFCDHLRTAPQFFCSTAEELLSRYRDICKRIDPGLAGLFGTLPRLPYGVQAVPAHAERSQTTAYYQPGSPEAGRPGWYFANTYDLASRPTWEMEALSLHEAVPGHHLQIALAQELDGLPHFRRQWSTFTAYVEGWGLYAESLGDALGCYRDPYSRFGQLTYEMWRAVRLVVDTGIHFLGWTREQAITYFTENSAKAEHDIAVEVDRYIVWPGQALAYKVGERTLRRLRQDAETALGDAFDVRAFHDAVLLDGALPLFLLEDRMAAWTARAAGQRAEPSR